MSAPSRRLRRGASALLLAAGLLLAVAALPGVPTPGSHVALAAAGSPTPAPEGDPRSSGEGAGLVGSPFLAIGGMLAIGLLAAGGTLLYVRLTGGARRG